MSLLALARQRLAELSQRDVPRGCPNGTNANEMARDALSCPIGLSLSTVPTGQVRDNGILGTLGTVGAQAERIRAYPCPDGFSPSRWPRVQDGAARFAEEWGARALALGWTEGELFALAEPFARKDIQGAAWFVGSATVAAVTVDAITLRTESGATLRIYRRGLQ
jgi:hypothetical protein